MSLSALKTIHSNFEQELVLSSQRQKTSLAFISNTLPSSPLVQVGEIFQTLIIGGSMYRNALLRRTDTGIKILSEITDKQPSFLIKEDLLAFVESHLDSSTTVLAINFAYPIEPIFTNGRLDGKLIKGTKENTFLGLAGQSVGEEIEKYIAEKHKRQIKVSVANDTVCLILSGLTKSKWDHLAAGIVGTGLNFAIFLDENTVVNLEAGGFTNFPQTKTGKIIDSLSNMKGQGLFEKEVSGAYLYQHFNQLIESKEVAYNLLTDTTELSILAAKNIPGISELAREHLERSASFVATQIAGIASFKKQPLTFIMQGSLFWKGHQYKETVAEYVKHLLPNYKINFIDIEHSDVLGAAKLVA